jgi:transcriptional regulator of acetoin/glycerol metabolism
MPNTWVAVDAGTDPLPWARLLRRAYDSAATGAKPASIVRPMVVESWRRSKAARIDPATPAPAVMDVEDALTRFEAHPLRSLLRHIEQVLLSVARYAGQVVAVADADGLVLWTGGDSNMTCSAKRAGLVPGAMWSEAAAGTNALGVALRQDHAVQVFSAEHYKQSMHGWSSAAAPVHDAESGCVLGVLSLSGPLKAAHPHGFSIVQAAAQIAEAALRHQAAERTERLKVTFLERVLCGYPPPCAVVNAAGRVLLSTPSGWLSGKLHLNCDGTFAREPAEPLSLEALDGGAGYLVRPARDGEDRSEKAALHLQALGRSRAEAQLGRAEFRLTQRHSEIVAILAMRPEGVTDHELMLGLYGETRSGVTVRAEISRLRRILGPVIQTRPYRLAADVDADFLQVEQLLEAGDVDAAASLHTGPLLPWSTAPAIVAARQRLERRLLPVAVSGLVADASDGPAQDRCRRLWGP